MLEEARHHNRYSWPRSRSKGALICWFSFFGEDEGWHSVAAIASMPGVVVQCPRQDASDEGGSLKLRTMVLTSAEAGEHPINVRTDDGKTINTGSGSTACLGQRRITSSAKAAKPCS